ncbi:MAG: tetratricopeptide repeat protein [Spirochaetota bacterium]|nr:MAG: tetratricopeptide repeat protein [Spirochaetota bacterium]
MRRLFLIGIIIFLVLTVVTAAGICAGTDHVKLYSEANSQYAAGEYAQALSLYLQLIERDINNHSLYYNTANAYFKLGETGYARLYYERALLLNPFDRDVRNNLRFLQNNMKEKIVPLYNEGLFKALSSLSSFITQRILGILEIIFFTAFIIVIHLYLIFPSLRENLRGSVYGSLALFMIFLVLLFALNSYEKNHPKGVVVDETIEVLSAPVIESEVLFSVYEGAKMKLKEERGDWIRISISDGREGWIQKGIIEFI